MLKKMFLSGLILTAVTMASGVNEARAAFSAEVGTPNLNFRISDYQPAPPNVYVHNDGGRPYYIERDHRVYMEKRKHGKHYKKHRKHNDDHGRKHGHDKHRDH